MNRDELIRAVSAAGGSTYLESSQFLDAVLPLIEADLRERLAAEIVSDSPKHPYNTNDENNWPRIVAWSDGLHAAASIVRGATADTDPAGDNTPSET